MDKDRRMFVFRLAHNNEPGEPIGACPLHYTEVMKKIKNMPASEIVLIEYTEETLQFLHDELWKHNILRQGWGLDGQDLRRYPEEKTKQAYMTRWNSNFMLNEKKRHGRNIDCSIAKGRWNILSRMLEFKKDDIIFLPKVAKGYIYDAYDHFTVCQVADTYYFNGPTQNDDFQHCIKVKNLKTFNYGQDTLLRSDFGSPYCYAILEARGERDGKAKHQMYDKFLEFSKKHFK